MLSKLSIEHKMYAVIGVSVIVGILGYVLSFSDTIELRKKLVEKRQLLENVDQVKKDIAFYEKKLGANTLNLNTDKTALQNKVLNQVTEFCSAHSGKTNLNIVEFLAVHEFHLEEKTVRTCSFSVKGDFSQLLMLNEELEKNLDNAKLSSVEYKLTEKRRTKELIATYHVQNISEL